MWELFWNLMIFFGGMTIGQIRSTNSDITNRTSYMQDLIDEAYEKRDAMKKLWLDAEEKAETWQRRYWATFEEEDEEEEVGS